MKRKEFEQVFIPYNENGKEIWITSRVRDLPEVAVTIACNLLSLDFINYVRMDDEVIIASSEFSGTRVKMPITRTYHPTAIGIELIYMAAFKTIDFSEITSPLVGHGSKMVDAVFHNFPANWTASVVFDYSEGFWGKMRAKHKDIDWLCSSG
jgi:hypothetical protein